MNFNPNRRVPIRIITVYHPPLLIYSLQHLTKHGYCIVLVATKFSEILASQAFLMEAPLYSGHTFYQHMNSSIRVTKCEIDIFYLM